MFKKFIIYTVSASLALIPALTFAESAPATGDSSSSVVATPVAPSTGDSVSSTASTPTTGGSVSSTGSTPSTGGSTSSVGTTPSTGDSTSSVGIGSSDSSPIISAGGGGSAVSGGSVLGTTTGAVLGASCPLISTFMTVGGSNNGVDVAKLQAFLKDSEKMNISVTGIYDIQTADSVKAFQAKYLHETMHPWGAAVPSGRVYITTLKKINQLACAQPLTLSASELAIIEAYKNKQNASDVTVTGVDQTGNNPAIIGGSNNDSNTAAAANSSVIERFWNFLKNIF